MSAVDDLAARIVAIERALGVNGTSAQLAHSSIENGAVPAYDAAGRLRSQVGRQFDGTYTSADFNGPPPPQTTGPYVEGIPGGLRVVYDGGWLGDAVPPMNLRLVEVHVSSTPGFSQDGTTLRTAFLTSRGGEFNIRAPSVEQYVVLVARNTAGIAGPASSEGFATPLPDPKGLSAGAVGWSELSPGLAGSAGQKFYDTMQDASRWEVVSGLPPVTVATAEARTGGYLMHLPGNGVKDVRSREVIPFDPDVLYRVTARVRSTGYDRTTFWSLGLVGVAADGATVTAAHPVAAARVRGFVRDGWTVHTGYVRGHAPDALSATTVATPDPTAPGWLHPDTRYVRASAQADVGSYIGEVDPGNHVDLFTIETVEVGAVDTRHLTPGVTVPGTVQTGNAGAVTNSGFALPAGTSQGYDDTGNPASQVVWVSDSETTDHPVSYIEHRKGGKLVLYNAANYAAVARTVTEISADDLDLVTGAVYVHRIQDDKAGFTGPGILHVNGRVESRQPAIQLYAAAAQSIPNATNTLVQFTDVQCDTGDMPHAGNSEVTIPRDGTYVVSGQLPWASATVGYRNAWVQSTQRGQLAGAAGPPSPSSSTVQNFSWTGSLSAGDVLRLRAQHSQGAALSTEPTFFRPLLSVAYLGWSAGGSYAAPVAPATTTRTDTFYPIASASWRDVYGGWRTDNDDVYQGAYGGAGTHRGYYFYDHAAIRAKLAGRVIDTAEVWAYRLTGSGDGGAEPLHLWAHNHDRAVEGTTGTPSLGVDYAVLGSLAPGTSDWMAEHPNLGVALRDNTAKGICFYDGTANYLKLAGRSAGRGNGAIRIKSTG